VSTQPPTVRRAAREDAPSLARLRYALRAGLDPAEELSDAFRARCESWMAERLPPGGPWRCWVAERDAAIVGAIWLQIVEKIPNPLGEGEWHGYVTNFFVDEHARGAGVGSALLAALIGAPDTERLDALFLWPTDRSRRLYARFGFVGTGGVIERRPAAGPPRPAHA
jgi:ribosomal protein S18 acetylase RimI-like enzyme